jgi:hypothetical protein
MPDVPKPIGNPPHPSEAPAERPAKLADNPDDLAKRAELLELTEALRRLAAEQPAGSVESSHRGNPILAGMGVAPS